LTPVIAEAAELPNSTTTGQPTSRLESVQETRPSSGGRPAVPTNEFPKLLADIRDRAKTEKSGLKGSFFPLGTALSLLESLADSDERGTDSYSAQTYSTWLNERILLERYGRPDEIAEDSILIGGSPFDSKTSRMLRYGWLRILVTTEGEIWAIKFFAKERPKNASTANHKASVKSGGEKDSISITHADGGLVFTYAVQQALELKPGEWPALFVFLGRTDGPLLDGKIVRAKDVRTALLLQVAKCAHGPVRIAQIGEADSPNLTGYRLTLNDSDAKIIRQGAKLTIPFEILEGLTDVAPFGTPAKRSVDLQRLGPDATVSAGLVAMKTQVGDFVFQRFLGPVVSQPLPTTALLADRGEVAEEPQSSEESESSPAALLPTTPVIEVRFRPARIFKSPLIMALLTANPEAKPQLSAAERELGVAFADIEEISFAVNRDESIALMRFNQPIESTKFIAANGYSSDGTYRGRAIYRPPVGDHHVAVVAPKILAASPKLSDLHQAINRSDASSAGPALLDEEEIFYMRTAGLAVVVEALRAHAENTNGSFPNDFELPDWAAEIIDLECTVNIDDGVQVRLLATTSGDDTARDVAIQGEAGLMVARMGLKAQIAQGAIPAGSTAAHLLGKLFASNMEVHGNSVQYRAGLPNDLFGHTQLANVETTPASQRGGEVYTADIIELQLTNLGFDIPAGGLTSSFSMGPGGVADGVMSFGRIPRPFGKPERMKGSSGVQYGFDCKNDETGAVFKAKVEEGRFFFFISDSPASSEHLTELLKKLSPQLVEKHAKLRKDVKDRRRKASATIQGLVLTVTKKGTVLSSPQSPTIFGSEASEYGW
jgi:hypothetical protein